MKRRNVKRYDNKRPDPRFFKTPVDYGLISVDLPKVAAMIAADLPTRLYYTAYRRNAFDTHVQQGELHQRLLTYVSDAVSGFMQDMERIGRAVVRPVPSDSVASSSDRINSTVDFGSMPDS